MPLQRSKCPGWELNPHAPVGAGGFKFAIAVTIRVGSWRTLPSFQRSRRWASSARVVAYRPEPSESVSTALAGFGSSRRPQARRHVGIDAVSASREPTTESLSGKECQPRCVGEDAIGSDQCEADVDCRARDPQVVAVYPVGKGMTDPAASRTELRDR